MKKLLIVVLGFFALSCNAKEHNEERFLQANDAFLKKEYTQALEQYQKVEPKGPLVWYNMAQTAYRLEHYSDALVYALRAYRFADRALFWPSVELIKEIKTALNMSVNTSAWYQVKEYLEYISRLVSLFLWQLLLVCLVWIVAFFVFRKQGSVFFLLISLLLILFLSVLVGIAYHNHMRLDGIVRGKQVSVYVGPDERFSKVGMLDHLEQISILEKTSEWYKVKHGNLIGWVPAQLLESV